MSSDLSGGDSTPKLVKASIKDLTLAVNLIAYTFKTPDSMVAPDALQLDGSGNLALGNIPLVLATVGRNFRVSNTSSSGGAASNSSVNVDSNSGTSWVNLTTASATSGIRHWDGSTAIKPRSQQWWSPTEQFFRHEVFDTTSGNYSTAFKINTTGQVSVGESSAFPALFNVGVVGRAGNELYVASNVTTFEGAFLGAYDGTSGAKLDLNTQFTSTTVGSWRLSHDISVGIAGKLSFRYAPAQTTRAALVYTERFALTPTSMLVGGGASRSVGGAARYLQIENTGQASISLLRDSNDASGSVLALAKSRGTVVGTTTIVQDGDELGNISFVAANGNNIDGLGASIRGLVSGTPSATSLPGTLVLSTTPVGAIATVEALRVTNQQNIAIGGPSDVARLVLKSGVTYASGEAMLYMQSSSPSTIPSLIAGASGGVIKIQAGAPLTTGGAPGGGIDLNGGGAATNPGFVFIRAGTNADGLSSPVIVTVAPTGMVGFNQTTPLYRNHVTGNTGERVRWMGDTFGEYAGTTYRRANGTAAAPTKILAGDQLGFINTHVYTGTQYVATGSFYILATGDHSDTSTPSDFIFAPGSDATIGQRAVVWMKGTGLVGINTGTPQAPLTVCNPSGVGGNGYEISPDSATTATIRSFNRLTNVYTDVGYAASSYAWGVGSAAGSAAGKMWLTTGGNLALGALIANGGTGVTVNEGLLTLSTATTSVPGIPTALVIQNGEQYAGLKFKAGPTTTGNGSCDYFDITTRPGASGVGANADRVMIRLEHAVSSANPDLYLQPVAAGGRVVVGAAVSTSTGRFNVVGFSGGGNIATFSGNTTTSANADVLIVRTGAAVSTSAGQGSSLQLSNGTNNSHILFQESANGLQLFNFTTGAWGERMFMASTGRFTFGAHSSAAGNTAETIQVIGGTTGGNDYCYFAQANTSAQAFAMRMFSTTANQIVGSITFTGSATAYNTSSDRRLKENIVDAPTAQSVIGAIQVRSFNFINGGDFYKYAMVAQELYNVAPWAVSPGSHDHDASFNGMNGIWSVDYSKLVPTLVKSQQETMVDVKTLQTQLAQSESKVTALETALADVLARLARLEGNNPA